MTGARTAAMTLPPEPQAVREARRLTQRLCVQVGCTQELTDAAVLLTSEIVTNAVTHGHSEATITVTAEVGMVLVEVGDDNSRPPMLQPVDENALDGRGIGLLDMLASEWGVRKEPVGKVVWFVVRQA